MIIDRESAQPESELLAPSKKSVTIDVLVLFLGLIALNLALGKSDPGWLLLNPTPWLLLPFFLGGRYGVVGGVAGALTAAVAVLGMQWLLVDAKPVSVISGYPYFFLGLLAAGAIGSFINFLVAGPMDRLRSSLSETAEKNLRLEEANALYRENESLLQESLLLHGAEYTSLTEQVNRIASGDSSAMEASLLNLYEQQLGVSSAGMYTRQGVTGPFEKISARGDSGMFPPTLSQGQSAIVDKAITTGAIVTSNQLWSDGDQDNREEPILAVVPWGKTTGEVSALLIIYRMAFESVSWETLSRIEAIFDWTMGSRAGQTVAPMADVESNEAPAETIHVVLSPDDFRSKMAQARTLNLASRLIVFSPSEGMSPQDQSLFLEGLKRKAGKGDTLGAMQNPDGSYAIGVLVAAASISEAERYATHLMRRVDTDSMNFQVFELFDEQSPNDPQPA